MKELILDLIGSAVTDEEFEVVDVIISSRLIRIFIDKQNGVTMAECTRLSRTLSRLFEESDADRDLEAYRLEVSSPGIDRPLSTSGDFKRNINRKVSVIFTVDDAVQSIEGRISAVYDEYVSVETNKKHYEIPYKSISKALLVLEW